MGFITDTTEWRQMYKQLFLLATELAWEFVSFIPCMVYEAKEQLKKGILTSSEAMHADMIRFMIAAEASVGCTR